MKYAPVKNAHIVPKAYLRNFSHDGKVAVHLRGETEHRVTSLDNAATRNRYYRRTRPASGEKIDDVEWSLSVLEGTVAPVLAELAAGGGWPLAREQKAKLAELFAFQLLRVPSWQEWAERKVREFMAQRDLERPVDTERLTLMLQLGHPIATLLGSMQWLLVEFGTAVLATSDEPVVIWPVEQTARDVAAPAPVFEFQHLLEVRVPVSPRLAIVMTWADANDRRVSGKRHHAANLNSFTIAQSDRQWFHQPGTSPPTTAGRLLPLSPMLLPGYDARVVASSKRRAEASKYALEGLAKPLSERDFWLVDVDEQTG